MQNIVPDDEWDLFYFILQKNLPTVFRVTEHSSQAKELTKILRSDFLSKMLDVVIEGEKVEPPQCISWYPGQLAWQINLTRKMIRSSDCFQKLHQFLVTETECGNISRQEVVSMLPPILLDIQPHHKILDMCAAPGSKTAQLLEYLHRGDIGGTTPSGYVVANDKDAKRCYLLVHQAKRIRSPCVAIVNHDASIIPTFFVHNKERSVNEAVQFDRILADVPCSGDGTLRKCQEIWRKWNPGLGINLHNLQKRILRRGLEMVAIGGRLVYSTCSFNPVEDEAVVASTLIESQGAVKLVDVSEAVPGLKAMPGLTTWKVVTKQKEVYSSMVDVPDKYNGFLKASMFPPGETVSLDIGLQQCMRILPHHQDTGGFFIAVLEKVTMLPWMKGRVTEVSCDSQGMNSPSDPAGSDIHVTLVNDTNDTTHSSFHEDQRIESVLEREARNDSCPSVTTSDDTKSLEEIPEHADTIIEENTEKRPHSPDNTGGFKKPKRFGRQEAPFIFFQESDLVWSVIRDFFGISPEFCPDQLMYRCAGSQHRNIYFVSEGIKKLAESNSHRVKFINMGVKVFGRNSSPLVPHCEFRLAQEGLRSIYRYIKGRTISITSTDLVRMLTNHNPFITTLELDTQTQLNALCPGSCVFIFTSTELDPVPGCDITICGWRGKTSVCLFLTQMEMDQYLRLCQFHKSCE